MHIQIIPPSEGTSTNLHVYHVIHILKYITKVT